LRSKQVENFTGSQEMFSSMAHKLTRRASMKLSTYKRQLGRLFITAFIHWYKYNVRVAFCFVVTWQNLSSRLYAIF
jgi:hypothetical protein